ncbi:unnamed protein product [Cyprideis torosa]|uniref:MATH domain-containing protein n=1 Tax=Cyprideis torosa TaxID=163714 RepID=A0A7R8WB18_9CRUS|nr:unnamed protein product [Cyprideis torosa]CAG0891757.1 unnamed protein product [Cyprideis torosa]
MLEAEWRIEEFKSGNAGSPLRLKQLFCQLLLIEGNAGSPLCLKQVVLSTPANLGRICIPRAKGFDWKWLHGARADAGCPPPALLRPHLLRPLRQGGLERQGTCPLCQRPSSASALVPNHTVRHVVGELRARCPEDGCGEVVELENLALHRRECVTRTSACSRGCGRELLNKEKATHNCVQDLQRECGDLRTEIERLREQVNEKDEEIANKDEQIASKEEQIARLDKELSAVVRKKYEEIASKDERIASKEEQIARLDKELSAVVRKKYEEIASRDELIANKNKTIASKDEQIASKEEQIARLDKELSAVVKMKDEEIASKDEQIASNEKEIAELSAVVKMKDEELSAVVKMKDEEISSKDEQIASNEEEIARLDEVLSAVVMMKDEEIANKDKRIARLDEELADVVKKKDEEIANKDEQIANKDERIARLDEELADVVKKKDKEIAGLREELRAFQRQFEDQQERVINEMKRQQKELTNDVNQRFQDLMRIPLPTPSLGGASSPAPLAAGTSGAQGAAAFDGLPGMTFLLRKSDYEGGEARSNVVEAGGLRLSVSVWESGMTRFLLHAEGGTRAPIPRALNAQSVTAKILRKGGRGGTPVTLRLDGATFSSDKGVVGMILGLRWSTLSNPSWGFLDPQGTLHLEVSFEGAAMSPSPPPQRPTVWEAEATLQLRDFTSSLREEGDQIFSPSVHVGGVEWRAWVWRGRTDYYFHVQCNPDERKDWTLNVDYTMTVLSTEEGGRNARGRAEFNRGRPGSSRLISIPTVDIHRFLMGDTLSVKLKIRVHH